MGWADNAGAGWDPAQHSEREGGWGGDGPQNSAAPVITYETVTKENQRYVEATGHYEDVTIQTGTDTVTTSKTVSYQVEQDLEDTFIPVMRPKFIFFKFENLRPNTAHWVFFDRKEVTKWVNTSYSISDGTDAYEAAALESLLKNPGEKYVEATEFPSTDGLGGPTAATGPVYTNASGVLEGVYYLQSNTDIHFSCGTRMLSVLDISVYNREAAFSYAEVPFEGIGKYDLYMKQTMYREEVTTQTVPVYATTKEWVEDTQGYYETYYTTETIEKVTNPTSGSSNTNIDYELLNWRETGIRPQPGTAQYDYWLTYYAGP